jgi:hypothetical protein
VSDPYLTAWARRVRNRARGEGVGGILRAVALPLATAAILVPLVRRVFLGFLDAPVATYAESVAQIVLRVQIVVVAWIALDVYGAVVRGQDRDVLSLLPVDAARVVRASLLSIAVARWWLVPAAAIVLVPLAATGEAGAVGIWLAAVVAIVAAYAGSLLVSAPVFLLAVFVAEDPRFAGLLDLVRGHNPRAQAAFLYAPGVVLLGVGALLIPSAGAVPFASGSPAAAFSLLAPVVPGIVAVWFLPDLARRAWHRASLVVAEIDARYAALADPEEARRVYLDWIVRWLPVDIGRWALADLRHGWRARRTLVSGAWFVALLAFAAGWTSDPEGPSRVLVVVVLGTFLVAANGVLLARDEPRFLQVWLPRGAAGAVARCLVLLFWVAPIPFLGALSSALRASSGDAGTVLLAGLATAAPAVGLAFVCGQWRDQGLVLYAPTAAICAVALAAAVATG